MRIPAETDNVRFYLAVSKAIALNAFNSLEETKEYLNKLKESFPLTASKVVGIFEIDKYGLVNMYNVD